ncbi:MAG: DUF6036 family nucleotidyltransferase [Opitutaceae bacterium]
MKLHQLEHLIRAAAAITNENPILVLGSQSILARFPNPPDPLGLSMEADVCPLDAPEKADEISGAIGEITVFQSTHGYYAHGLPPEACPLAQGWRERLVVHQNENTRGYTALCLHPDDLACSKLAAGRGKDIDFVATMLAHRMVAASRLEELAGLLPDEEQRSSAQRNFLVVRRRAQNITQREPGRPAL